MAGKKGKAKRRRYSDQEKSDALVALAANGGNIKKTATDLGIPQMTLASWAKGNVHPEVTKLRDEKKAPLADALEDLARKMIGAAPDKIGETTLQPLITSLGIAIDKMQVLRGKPTNINQHDFDSLSDDQLRQQVAVKKARLLARTGSDGVGVAGTGGTGTPAERTGPPGTGSEPGATEGGG